MRLNLSHFENGRDVTVYFILDRTEIWALLLSSKKYARN